MVPDVVFKVVHERFVVGEDPIVVDIIAVTIRIFKSIRAVQGVHPSPGGVPSAQAAGFPTVGEAVAIGIDVVGVRCRPLLRRSGGLSVGLEQLTVGSEVTNDRPLVLAEVGETVTVRIPECVIGSQRVKGPVVASGERGAHPAAMLDFPTVGHPIAVRVGICRIGGCVDVGDTEVGCIGRLACGIVAYIHHLNGVVAPKVARFEKETEVFRTVTQAVTVGVTLPWVRGVVSIGCGGNIAEFVKIGPQPFQVHVTRLVEVQTVAVRIVKRIPGIGGIQPVDDFPSIGHAV